MRAIFMHKKGVSQAVGFVLLVGLSIGLAIFVGVWIKEQSKKSISGIADNLEKDTKCDDTLLTVVPNCKNSGICGWGVAKSKCYDNPGCRMYDGDKQGCLRLDDICNWIEDTENCQNAPGCKEYNSKEIECKNADVFINSLNLSNKGLFSIVQVQCNGKYVVLGKPLDPDEEQVLNNAECNNIQSVLVVPFVNLSTGEAFGCASKKVRGVC